MVAKLAFVVNYVRLRNKIQCSNNIFRLSGGIDVFLGLQQWMPKYCEFK
jgi:hypothetical protein